ncbi:MAG: PEP-CTERM sorting domain-containing protein [Phycisphaerae bacterium]|nr:PEP-CTERM sorting domain-containing protein [Phycisphaerae bacterium]
MKNWIIMAMMVACVVSLSYGDTIVFFDDFLDSSWQTALGGYGLGTPTVGEAYTADQDNTNDISLTGNAVSGSYALMLQRGTDPQVSSLYAHISAANQSLIEQTQSASWMFDLNNTGAGAGFLFSSGGTCLANISFGSDGHVTYYDGATHDTGLTYTTETYQDIQIDIDFANDTFTISANGNTTTGSTDIPFLAAATTLDTMRLVIDKNDVARVDNWTLTTVPEPMTLGVLAAGGVVLLRRRRR